MALAFGRWGWGVPIWTKGQTLWYSRYICMYFVVEGYELNALLLTPHSLIGLYGAIS
jgi:hypothetical protein